MHHTHTKVVRSRKQQLRGTSPPWWAVQDLNLRPHACEACALTTELTAQSHATQALNHSAAARVQDKLRAWCMAGSVIIGARCEQRQRLRNARRQSGDSWRSLTDPSAHLFRGVAIGG